MRLKFFVIFMFILKSAFASHYRPLPFKNSAQLINDIYNDSKTFKDFIQRTPLPSEIKKEFVDLSVTKNFYNLKLPKVKLLAKPDGIQFVIEHHELKIKNVDNSVRINGQILDLEKIKNFEDLYKKIESLLGKSNHTEAFNKYYNFWIRQVHAINLVTGGLIGLAAIFSIFLATLDSISNHSLLKFAKDKFGLFSPTDVLVENEFLQVKCERQIVDGKEKFFPSEVKITVKCKNETDCGVNDVKLSYKDGQLSLIKDSSCLISRSGNGVFRAKPRESESRECSSEEYSEKQFNMSILPLKTLEFQCEKYPETEVFRTVFPISGVSKSRENFENEKVRINKTILRKSEPAARTSNR